VTVSRRLNVEDRRAQLLELALELFAGRTYEEISIDEIAKAAGVSKGLLYHYFPGKRAFYVAAVRHAATQLLEETRIERTGPPDLDDVRRGLDRYLDYVERHATAYVFLLEGGMASDPEVRRIIDETRRAFVARAIEGLDVTEEQPALRVMMRGYVAFAETAILDWLEHGEPDRETLRELLVRICEAAVTLALT